jgi:hypothetical protein
MAHTQIHTHICATAALTCHQSISVTFLIPALENQAFKPRGTYLQATSVSNNQNTCSDVPNKKYLFYSVNVADSKFLTHAWADFTITMPPLSTTQALLTISRFPQSACGGETQTQSLDDRNDYGCKQRQNIKHGVYVHMCVCTCMCV